jgi:hypothetical protein
MGIPRTAGLSLLLTALMVSVLLAVAPSHVSAAIPSTPTAARKSSAGPASKPYPAAVTSVQPAGAPRDRAAEQRELRRAKVVLAELQKRYRYLDGVTLRVDPTPDDRQAVAYYTDGEIVISPDHVATIDKILAHEVWHIIDYRDNGRLDWGEDLPPSNASDYRSKY